MSEQNDDDKKEKELDKDGLEKLRKELEIREAELEAKEKKAKEKNDKEKPAKEEIDLSGLDEKTRKKLESIIAEHSEGKKERDETKEQLEQLTKGLKSALGIEDESQEDPQETIQRMVREKEEAEYKLEISRLAAEFDLPQENLAFFEYLLDQASFPEGDDEESEEQYQLIMEDIVDKVKAVGKKGRSSVGPGAGTDDDGRDDHKNKRKVYTFDEFRKLGIGDRSELFDRDPKQYGILIQKEQEEERRLRS